MNAKYVIIEASVVDGEIVVKFDCSLNNVVIHSDSIKVPSNTTADDVLDRINIVAYNAAIDEISVKEHKQKQENEKKEKHDDAVDLKIEVDKNIGKSVPVEKPEKKEKK
jgi:hypothetical protein